MRHTVEDVSMRRLLIGASVSLGVLASAAAADLPVRWKTANTPGGWTGFFFNAQRSFGPEEPVFAPRHGRSVRKHFRQVGHAIGVRADKLTAKHLSHRR